MDFKGRYRRPAHGYVPRFFAFVSLSFVIATAGFFDIWPRLAPELAYAQEEHANHEQLVNICSSENIDPKVTGLDVKCGKVGEAVRHVGAEVYVDSVIYTSSYTDVLGKQDAATGNKFVIVDVTLKNTGNSPILQDELAYAIIFPEMQSWEDRMRLNSSKNCGYISCTFVITSRAASKDTIKAVIPPDNAVRGTAYFEVPAYETRLSFLYEISGLRQGSTDLAKIVVIDLSKSKVPADLRPSSDNKPSSDLEVGSSSTNGAVEIGIDSKRVQNSVEVAGNTYNATSGWKVYLLDLSITNNGNSSIALEKIRIYLRDGNDYSFITFPAEGSGSAEQRSGSIPPAGSVKRTVASFVPESSERFTLVYFEDDLAEKGNVVIVPEFPFPVVIALSAALILLMASNRLKNFISRKSHLS